MQIGAFFQPITEYSIGMKTGLYWEQYFASGSKLGYDSFRESNIYLPIDLVYRVPFTNKIALTLLGTVSMNLVLAGLKDSMDSTNLVQD